MNDLLAPPLMRRRIALAFFLSGFAGLVYQIVWTRLLLLGFGATTEAVATVVAAFMAGLAIGSFAGGRLADRQTPEMAFRLYALFEACVAAFCLLTPSILGNFPDVFATVENILGNSRVVRALSAGLILLPPTALMGATLPILVRACSVEKQQLGHTVGWLYAINTAGAVAGAFLTGFLLILFLGINGAVYLAALFNVLAAILVWRMASRIAAVVENHRERDGSGKASDQADICLESAAESSDIGRSRVLLIISASFSGAVALGLEILWTRTIILSVGSSTQAVALMLTTFLAGIACGSAIYSRIAPRLRSPIRFAAWLQFAIAIASIFLLRIATELPFLYISLWDSIGKSGLSLVAIRFIPVFLLMFGPTLLMGANLPALIAAYSERGARVGREVGTLYAANTVGAIAGPLLVGLVILPMLGVTASTAAVAGAGLLGGTAALLADRKKGGRSSLLYLPVPVIFVLAILLIPKWDPVVMARGLAYKPVATKLQISMGTLESSMARYKTLFYRDGPEATVAVFETGGEKPVRNFVVNGRPEASTHPADMRNQYLLGHLPALLHRDPVQKGLVIALGSGMTAGCLSLHAPHVRVVELTADVIGAAAQFAEWNYDALNNPGIRITIDDGRHFLLTTEETYDVITVDPIHPSVAGSEALYSRDHYRLIASRLAPGGVAAQWLPLYLMGIKNAKTIARTFQSVFPDAQIWINGMDAILIGGAGEKLRPASEIRELLEKPAIADSLRRVRQNNLGTLLAGYALGQPDFDRYVEGAPISTDNRPVIEFSLAWQTYQQTHNANMLEIFSFTKSLIPISLKGLSDEEHESFKKALKAVRLDIIALALQEAKQYENAGRYFRLALETNPDDAIALVALRRKNLSKILSSKKKGD
ncbi:fused MFS/spermidine synthase [Thermodesulfobacteriota bacterium]